MRTRQQQCSRPTKAVLLHKDMKIVEGQPCLPARGASSVCAVACGYCSNEMLPFGRTKKHLAACATFFSFFKSCGGFLSFLSFPVFSC